jgi:serine/threonine protein kinase/tetratricopeptide (TPR) repeat protein
MEVFSLPNDRWDGRMKWHVNPTPPGPQSRPPAPDRPALSAAQRARVEELFHCALERAPGEREAYVNEACAWDKELKEGVQELLIAHEAAANFLQPGNPKLPEIERELARLKPEEAGERIGPYKLLQQIGQGGFGTVWMAEQDQPVRRRVALKIIKIGMDTKEVVARFEQERQALAMMDHPNIAKVFDAGATPLGRPFFVMEFVHGVKITDFCDEQQLSMEERIELFIHVCRAVQHAHQKGIIHRDLKPSNILVTINDGASIPKVIDFGVAKATQGRLTDGTLFTQFDQMIGTPLYMSPEQAEMTPLDVDTRSDIYSLGVLLYELLTGHTPIDAETMRLAGVDEMRRLIREVEPPRPSLRIKALGKAELTTAAKRRHVEAARLSAALRGDLDWIVMKCLEKDRRRRYDSASSLTIDLQRHLRNEVITARPPTTSYLLGKLIRRNKLAFAAAAAVIVALIAGVIGTTLGLLRAEKERRAAEASQKLAEQRFHSARRFVDDVFEKVAPEFSHLIGASKAKETLARTSLAFVESLGDPGKSDEAFQADLALLYARLAQSLGDAYNPNSLGDYEAALRFAQQSLTLWNDLLSKNPSDMERVKRVGGLELQVGSILAQFEKFDEALPHYQRALAMNEALARARPDDGRSAENIAFVRARLGAMSLSRHRAHEALEEHYLPYFGKWLDRPLSIPTDLREAHNCYVAHTLVGEALLELERAAEALPHFEKAFEWVKIKVEMNPNNARSARDWSELLRFIGKTQIALGQAEEGAQKLEEGVRRLENLVKRDPANGQCQLDLIDALEFQANGFAARANLPGNSPRQQAELWRHAIEVFTKCQQRLDAQELQRSKLALKPRAERIAKAMSEARLALEKLATHNN